MFMFVQSIRTQVPDGRKKKQKQRREMDGSIESVNTQSLHNKSAPGLPLSVLHCIQAF
jgi:hypothetical protein